jgi:Caudovirus prohead serine protease
VSAPLTRQQAAIFAAVHHYHDVLGSPAPASYVAGRMGISKQRVRDYYKRLFDLGWLKGPTSPAVPARGLPAHEHPFALGQLPTPPAAPQGGGMATRSAADPAHPLAPRTVSMPPLCIRAAVASKTMDDEARTVELVFTTGAPVERFDWETGATYLETLSLEPEHVRLDRLNDGAPLLDSHSGWSLSGMLGTVVPGSATLTKKDGRATVRFSKRDEVEPIWQDVRDGIIRSVSVGYRVHKFEETPAKGNKLPVRKAIDWEPYEVSMVPMPADPGARVRAGRGEATNPCEILPVVVRAATETPAVPTKENEMPENTPSETMVEADPLAPPPKPRDPTPTEPNDRDRGVAAERERVAGIRAACKTAHMTRAFETKLIESGLPLVDCQGMVFAELGTREPDVPRSGSRPAEVGVGDDPLIHVRAGIENALLHRVRPKSGGDPKGFELSEQGRPYRGMTLLRIAEAYLAHIGIRTTALGKMQIASLALGLDTRSPGMHTTSDFANLLADVANKTLRRAYEEAPQTWVPFSRRTTLPDFKPVKRLQIGEAPALLEVGEHGEFTFGTIGEGKEQFQLATYGRRFAITRKALVNDDTDAFSRVPTLFGRAARNLESDLVWAQITTNPVMGDGVTLFHANHGNLSATSDAISVASIGAGRAAMRVQKGVDGTTLLNINPNYLAVPAAKETIADQFVSTALMVTQSSNVNPFAGRLQVIAEPRLDANSVTAWYLVATPDQIDVVEYAYLEGEEGPMVESRVGWEIDGLEIKCREDFAAKVIDYRGLWKNPGA